MPRISFRRENLCGSRRSTSLVCEILPAGYELERREIAPDFGLGSAASMAPDQPLLLGIDIATAGCTSLVIDQDGRERARASVEYGYRSPRPGWAEQDANQWWEGVCTTVRACVDQLGGPRAIAAAAIDSHLEAVVPIDRHGEARAPGLLWLDQRTVPQAERLHELLDESDVLARTGVNFNHVNPVTKLMWLREHLPEAYDAAQVFLPPKDYARYKLTGTIGTDYSVASKTMLFDIRRRRWAEDICLATGVDCSRLPPVSGAWEVGGRVCAAAAAATGLLPETPIAVGGGDDHVMSLAGPFDRAGDVSIGTGTGSTWKVRLDEPSPDPLGRFECHCDVIPESWIYWGSINATGFSAEWVIEQIVRLGSSLEVPSDLAYARMEDAASGIEPGAESLLFYPHFWGARAPRLNPQARAVLFGLSDRHRAGHVWRAILEGVAYQHRGMVQSLQELGVQPTRFTMVGGETRSALWNQIKADVLGLELAIPEQTEASALGSAILAGVAVGVYRDVPDGITRTYRERERVVPQASSSERYSALYDKYMGVYEVMERAYTIAAS